MTKKEEGSTEPTKQDTQDTQDTPLVEAREDGEVKDTFNPSSQELREVGEDVYTSKPPHEVLNDMRTFHKRFVYHENESIHDLMVLWSVHTYALDSFVRTPRIYVHAPEKNCGKSTQGDLLEFYSCNPENMIGITAAVLFRLIEQRRPTLIIDEVDTVFTSRRVGTDDIKAVLNAGYARDKFVWRCNAKTNEPEQFAAYAAVALVGIDNRAIPDTIISRSIPVNMTRASVRLESFDPYMHEDYRKYLEEELPKIASLIPSRDRPTLPSHLKNRDAEVWGPLFTVANTVGGDWPERCLRASQALHWETTVSESTKVLSLSRDFFSEFPLEKGVPAQMLTDYINRAGTAEFITPKQLNTFMSTYGVSPSKTNGVSTYHKHDLAKAWDQWLEPVENLPNLPAMDDWPIVEKGEYAGYYEQFIKDQGSNLAHELVMIINEAWSEFGSPEESGFESFAKQKKQQILDDRQAEWLVAQRAKDETSPWPIVEEGKYQGFYQPFVDDLVDDIEVIITRQVSKNFTKLKNQDIDLDEYAESERRVILKEHQEEWIRRQASPKPQRDVTRGW